MQFSIEKWVVDWPDIAEKTAIVIGIAYHICTRFPHSRVKYITEGFLDSEESYIECENCYARFSSHMLKLYLLSRLPIKLT